MNPLRSSPSAVAVVVFTLVITALTTLTISINPSHATYDVTFNELRNLHQLADRIRYLKAGDSDLSLNDAVKRLSIRESAVLGSVLMNSGYTDIMRWLKLPAEREEQGAKRLSKSLAKLTQLARDARVETVIRGTQALRSLCGDDVLKEVISIQIRQEDDDGLTVSSPLTDDDLHILSTFPGLERIWIEATPVTDQIVAELSSLPRLVEFHLVNCELVTNASLKRIARPKLRVLDLRYNRAISDEGIAHLDACQNLQSLELGGSGITSKTLSRIAHFRRLNTLDLSHTAVRNDMEPLGSLRELKKLDLSRLGTVEQPLSRTSLSFLADCQQLEFLDLSSTVIQRIEIQHLHQLNQLRMGNRTLQELVLIDLPKLPELRAATDWMHIGSPATLNKVTLRGLSSLYILSLKGLTDAASNELAQGLSDSPRLFDIELPESEMTDSLATAIGNLQSLERLWVKDTPVSGHQLQSILRASKLQNLNCSGERLTAQDWNKLGQSSMNRLAIHHLKADHLPDSNPWTNLTDIELNQCQIGKLELGHAPRLYGFSFVYGTVDDLQISDCPGLKRISLLQTASDRISVQSCPELESFFAGFKSKIELISLSDLETLGQITIQEYSTIGTLKLSNLPRLKFATFWLMKSIPLDLLVELTRIPSLRKLDISSTTYGDEAAPVIARMKGLESLYASSFFTRAGLLQLRSLPALKELYLYRRTNADWSKSEVRELLPSVRFPTVFEVHDQTSAKNDGG